MKNKMEQNNHCNKIKIHAIRLVHPKRLSKIGTLLVITIIPKQRGTLNIILFSF
jgi:hypothetical protein